LGVGFDELKKSNLYWVLSSVHISVKKLPKWQDITFLETWPSGISGAQFTREFNLYSENNDLLVSASTNWVMIDNQTNKPRVPEEYSFLSETKTTKAVDSIFSKVRPRKDMFPAFKECAKYSDIDLNNHVNNAVFVRWVENCIGNIAPRRINSFKIQYLNPVKLNDEVVIFNESTSNAYYFEARINGDPICFRAEISLY